MKNRISFQLPSILLGVVTFVVLYQFITLNARSMNSDEAIYLQLVEHLKALKLGLGGTLNPVVSYEGPLDFWLLGSVYALFSKVPQISANAWMVRIVPLVLFWIGATLCYREVKKYSKKLAPWFLFFAAVSPMCLVYSRTAFPNSLLLPPFFILLAEVLRIGRLGAQARVRWLRIAILCGIAVEFHSTAFFGFVVLFAPVLPLLLRDLRRRPWLGVLSAGVFALLAYPVVRNFPPPVAGAPGHSIALEIRNFANMISGNQPFFMLLRVEKAPDVLLVPFLLFLPWLFSKQVKHLRKEDPFLFRVWVAHFVGSLLLAVFCYRGRSLTLIGHERYFLSLIPGWTLLWADAFSRMSLIYPKWKKHEILVALSLFVFFFGRFGVPMTQFMFEDDPSRLASQWLQRECPREKCLAYADNYWNYWTIRYYTRDSIDVNVFSYNWIVVKKHPANGRELAACMFFETEKDFTELDAFYKGGYRHRMVIPPQSAHWGQMCLMGISGFPPRD